MTFRLQSWRRQHQHRRRHRPTNAMPGFTTVLTQNFESGLGSWTAVNNSTRVGQTLTLFWAVQTNPCVTAETLNSGAGSKFAIANSDAAGSGVTADTTLTSPSFSTVRVQHPECHLHSLLSSGHVE